MTDNKKFIAKYIFAVICALACAAAGIALVYGAQVLSSKGIFEAESIAGFIRLMTTLRNPL